MKEIEIEISSIEKQEKVVEELKKEKKHLVKILKLCIVNLDKEKRNLQKLKISREFRIKEEELHKKGEELKKKQEDIAKEIEDIKKQRDEIFYGNYEQVSPIESSFTLEDTESSLYLGELSKHDQIKRIDEIINSDDEISFIEDIKTPNKKEKRNLDE